MTPNGPVGPAAGLRVPARRRPWTLRDVPPTPELPTAAAWAAASRTCGRIRACSSAWGGREGIARWIDTLYDRLEADPKLAPKFARDTHLERTEQRAFFEQWSGGEPVYAHHD